MQRLALLGLILPLLCLASLAVEAKEATSRHILLRGKVIDTAREAPLNLDRKALYLAHFNTSISGELRFRTQKCFRSPRDLVHYIPNNAFLVRATPSELRCIKALPESSWIGPFSAENKIAPALSDLSKVVKRFMDAGRPLEILAQLDACLPSLDEAEESPEDFCATALSAEVTIELPSLLSPYGTSFKASVAAPFRVLISLNGHSDSSLTASLSALVYMLSRHAEVTWIEPRFPPKPLLRYAKQLAFTPLPDALSLPTPPPTTLPLTGLGEIVGVADTGLHTDLPWFFDANVPVVYDTPMPNHRKVVLYATHNADSKDTFNGHGTFCSSEIVGQIADTTTYGALSPWDGLASGARIAFVDISNGSVTDLLLPLDLGSGIYQYTYDAGARVHSDSWGGDPEGPLLTISSEVSADTVSTDLFIWNHPDFLNVRAAGNTGFEAFSTIVTQACSKNALVVGSSGNSLQGFLDWITYQDYATAMPLYGAAYCPINSSYCNITWDPANPPCGDQNLQALCPSFLTAFYSNATVAQLYFANSLSEFSSKGPTHDQRIKPDVVMSGSKITAAKSPGGAITNTAMPFTNVSAFLYSGEGTSFATPIAAGSALLIREYLRRGFYPSGAENAGSAITSPPASLIKAWMINSAQQLTGSTLYRGLPTPLSSFANRLTGSTYADGFGRVSLDRILYFQSQGPPTFSSLLVAQEDVEVSTGQVRAFCFSNPSAAGNVRITLVWTDYPAFTGSQFALLSNLDLVVRTKNSTLFGNGITDTTNNVEVISANINAGDTFRVEVVGTLVPVPHQLFSLVVTGAPGLVSTPNCVECLPGTSAACFKAHGVGVTKCNKHGRYGRCYVQSCQDGYSTSTWTNRCDKFANYYLVIGVGAAFFILLSVLVCLGLCMCYRMKLPKLANRAGSTPVDIWDAYAIYYLKAPLFILGSTLSLTGSSCALVQPLFVGELVQRLPTTQSFGEVRHLFFYILAFICLEFVLSSIGDFLGTVAAARALRDLRNVIFRGVIALEFQLLAAVNKTELQTRVLNDTAQALGVPSTITVSIFGALIKGVVGVVVALFISWQLGLVFLAIIPPLAFLSWGIGRLVQPRQAMLLKLYSEVAGRAYDILAHIYLVKLYIQEDVEERRFKEMTQRYYKVSMVNIIIDTLGGAGRTTLLQVAAFAMLWYGSVLVIQPAITTGLLLTFFLYVGLAASGVGVLASVWPSYTRMLGSVQRIFELCNLHKYGGMQMQLEEVVGFSADSPLANTKTLESLGVRNLIFRYPTSPDTIIFKNMSLNLKGGTINAVLGPSGSGKTSLLGLISGLYKPNDGQIFYNNVDLTQLPPQDTYRLVSVCEQQPKLMNKTIWENLTYGAPNATRDEVWAVCEAVNLHNFIRGLPKGYDSVIGTDLTPSGGQAQRMGIVRTLIKEGAQLILMDEPTSELDVESQKMVLDYLVSLRGKKTVMFITHNLTALERVDNILFLQNGKLEESGPHRELIRKKGSYYQFLKISFQMAGKGDDFAAAALDSAGQEPVDGGEGKKLKKRVESMEISSHVMGLDTVVPKTIVQPRLKEKSPEKDKGNDKDVLLAPRKKPNQELKESTLLGNFYGIEEQPEAYISAAAPVPLAERARGRSRAMSAFEVVPVDELEMDL